MHLRILLPSLAIALVGSPAAATFHLMQIEQVIGGIEGDPTTQAIQLRMRTSGQHQVQFSRLRAWSASGQSPVMVLNIASSVAERDTGDRVLIVSANFPAHTSPPCVPDFFMTELIPASYLAAGSLTFEDDTGTILWRLSWGGSAYTGSTLGSVTNDLDGQFGPPWPEPLPSTTTQALLFQGAATDRSTNNAADYALTDGDAVFTSNHHVDYAVFGAPLTTPGGLGPGPLRVLVEPNPFRSGTHVAFELPRAETATLLVLDTRGREIVRLEDVFSAGVHAFDWDGRSESGRRVVPGAYPFELVAGPFRTAGTFVILR